MIHFEDTRFLVLGPVDADDVLAVQPDGICGYPSPTAVAGLGYATTLKLNAAVGRQAFAHGGTAVIVHDHSMHDGHAKHTPPASMRKDKDLALKGAPVVDEMRARLKVSFVVQLAPVDPAEPEDFDAAAAAAIPHSPGILTGLAFHGAKCFPTPGAEARIVMASELVATLAALPAGYVLTDRRDILESEFATRAKDPLDAILDAVEWQAPDGETEDLKGKRRRRLSGWLVPLFVGYQGIERPRERAGMRRGHGPPRHVYAESLYSLGEWRSLRTALASGYAPLDESLWRHETAEDSATYYVSAIGPVGN